jgi:hypothetical protein
MAFGAGGFPTRWSPEAGKKYRAQTGRQSLGKDYPIRRVGEVILNRYPVLNGLEQGKIDCFDLMFIESEAIIQAILRLLREHDIPSLPVFDSLIVKKNHLEAVMEVLRNAYEEKVGVRPALRVK